MHFSDSASSIDLREVNHARSLNSTLPSSREYLVNSVLDALLGDTRLSALLSGESRSGISVAQSHHLVPDQMLPVFDEGSGPEQYSQRNRASKALLASQAFLIQCIALKNSYDSLKELQQKLFVISNPSELSLIYRELAVYIQDIGSLLALSHQPTISYSLIDVSRVIRLLTHILSATDLDGDSHISEVVNEAALYFYGGLFASHRGIVETANTMEDAKFEQIWLKSSFGEHLNDLSLISEIRKAPGVLSITEEIRRCSRHFSLSSTIKVSTVSLAAAAALLIDCWRSSQIILQLHLGDMEQVRRHSDVISHSCLRLAKLCTYECGREALCAALIDTRLPLFLIALERHSTVQIIIETARYLSIQLFHTAVQYRCMLAPSGLDALTALFWHIEPSTLSPILFCQPNDQQLSPQVDVLLESIDHPGLLWTDVNFTCQLCMILDSLALVCSDPARCSLFIMSLSQRRLPYSSTALICAALDEVTNAVSLTTYGDELPPGYLRYARPPFPLLSIDSSVNGSQILQEANAKLFNFRSGLSLCEILMYLFQYYNDPRTSDGIVTISSSHHLSVLYLVKTCMRAIHVCRSSEELPLSPASKLERASLRMLSTFVAVEFPSDVTLPVTTTQSTVELVVREILCQNGNSPRFCETSGRVLCFLISDWRSQEVLINNRLVGEFRNCLQNFQPEISNWLSMWDGDSRYIYWLLVGGQEVMETVWEEILSRVEFWLYRGHSRYTLKWLGVVSQILSACKNRSLELAVLDSIVSRRVLSQLPAAEAQSPEMETVWSLCEDLAFGNVGEPFYAKPNDIEDLIYVNCNDYLENMSGLDPSPVQRPTSPTYWRGRLSPERSLAIREEDRQSPGHTPPTGASAIRNGGGGKIYTQNEFRSAHGASRNTSRAPSVHVDDFYMNT